MASFSPQTHYEILGITQQAQLQDIKDAFRRLALKHHPDKDPLNPQANAAFQRLGAAYETLSDTICRAKYDATLASYQRAGQRRPADWQNQTSSNASAWQEDMRRRAWNWCRNAQDAADQARREDTAYWSGPSYAHGAFDGDEWRKQQGREKKEKQDLYEYQQQQRAARKAARKEARKEAERNKPDTSIPPPRRTSDQDGDEYDYDDEECDPPFCNDFHDSHMEVHREFWDIIDSWHECSFCHAECTVMRCPRCDVQACASCKDAYG